MRIQAPRVFRFPPKMLCKDKHNTSIAKSNTTLQLQKEGFGNFTMKTVFQFRHELQQTESSEMNYSNNAITYTKL
jgi:hypothetical protein